MKAHLSRSSVAAVVIVVALGVTGCNRQSRGNADAEANRAATPGEGGATSTAGSAGESKNFGDTRTKTEVDGRSPSASPTGLSKDTKTQHAVETPAAGASTTQEQNQPRSGK